MRISLVTSLLFVGLGLALSVTIIWAVATANFAESLAAITRDPWGIVMLIDLYSGLIFAGVLIFYLEGQKPSAWLWLIASFFLGNIVTALWFVLHARRRLGNLG